MITFLYGLDWATEPRKLANCSSGCVCGWCIWDEMNIEIDDPLIPGTILKRKDMGDVTGMEFLNKIFYVTDGIMLTPLLQAA